MAQATINARLNATVKERGDKVLRDNGISTTEAIRGLWSSMARTREVPSFLVRECKCDETAERRRKREVARGLVGLETEGATLSDDALSDLRFQALLSRYEVLS